MKSKASYFSLSLPLIKENIRRFWALSAVGFLIYFLSGVFPILMAYGHINTVAGYISQILDNIQPFYAAANLVLPIFAAVLVFRYVQTGSAVTAMHSMPVTRAKLYNSNFLSGMILSLAPVIANGIILLALAKPAYEEWMLYPTTLPEEVVNMFARTEVLLWIWQTVVIMLVVYSIAVFAGMVTGNSVMHLALGFGFNFLIPGLYCVFVLYCGEFLYGYASNGAWEQTALAISPYLEAFDCSGIFTPKLTIYYLVNALVLIAINSVLYHKRKMERVSDSLVYSFMIPVISFLIAYFGMTLLGFYLKGYGDTEQEMMYFIGGLAAGTIIFFIIGRMIVKKTPRVFNTKSLLQFGIYVVIAAVFVSTLAFDFTGFETRVPDNSKIKGVAVSGIDGFNYGDRFEPANFTDDDDFLEKCGDYGSFYYKEPANIEAARQLHKIAIDHKSAFNENETMRTTGLDLDYEIGKSLPMQRSYSLPYSLIADSPYAKQLFESEEFKTFFSLDNFKMKKLDNINILNSLFTEIGGRVENKNDLNELWACLEEDFQTRSFEDQVSLDHPYCELEVEYKPNMGTDTMIMSMQVRQSDKNTITWLREHDFARKLELTADMISRMEFYEYDENEEETMIAYEKEGFYEEDNMVVIEDKTQIDNILKNYKSDAENTTHNYWGSIVLPADVYYELTDGNMGSMDGRYEGTSSYSVYFDVEDAPDFLKAAFDELK